MSATKFLDLSGLEHLKSKFDSLYYALPSGGIPKTNLDSSVQSSLTKADSALQSHQPLTNYYTKTQTDSAIAAAIGNAIERGY